MGPDAMLYITYNVPRESNIDLMDVACPIPVCPSARSSQQQAYNVLHTRTHPRLETSRVGDAESHKTWNLWDCNVPRSDASLGAMLQALHCLTKKNRQ